MVVEDEAIIAHDIHESLTGMGYEVVAVVDTGVAAVEKASGLQPDLILMDVVLRGDMDGVQAARLIRERTSCPIMFLTAHADPITLERSRTADPFGYLVKPIDRKQLFTNIEVALYKSKLDRNLRENDAWLTGTLQSIRDALIAVDAERKVVFVNHAAEKLTGRPESEVRGICVDEAFPFVRDLQIPELDHPFSPSEDEDRRCEGRVFKFRAGDGSTRTLVVDRAPILTESGARLGALHVFHDVTALLRANTKLRLLSRAVEQSSEGIVLMDLTGRVIFLNRAFAESHGYEPDELIGADLSVFHSESQLPSVRAIMERVLKDGHWTGEVTRRHRDGVEFPVVMHNTVFRDSSGNPIGFMGALRDITDLKNAQEELMRSHLRLEEYSHSLERNVQERTVELARSQEILREYSETLERTNEALRVVIGAVEKEKSEIEKRIGRNVRLTIRPILDQLRRRAASDSTKFLLHTLEFNLENLVSPFGASLSGGNPRLTPRETRICEMVRSGLSSKQIAEVMGISHHTILVHRRNIRRKLGLKKSRKNLTSYLRQCE
jgi:PAS domain S-box-containing protein